MKKMVKSINIKSYQFRKYETISQWQSPFYFPLSIGCEIEFLVSCIRNAMKNGAFSFYRFSHRWLCNDCLISGLIIIPYMCIVSSLD